MDQYTDKESLQPNGEPVDRIENRTSRHSSSTVPELHPGKEVLSVCEHFSVVSLTACTCLNLIPDRAPKTGSHSSFAGFVIGQPDTNPDWDETFDLIICDGCYHEADTLENLAADIYRLLKPGGFCYLSGNRHLSSPRDDHGSIRRVFRTEASILKYLADFWIHDYAELIEQSPAAFCRTASRRTSIGELVAAILRRRRCLRATEFVWILTKKR